MHDNNAILIIQLNQILKYFVLLEKSWYNRKKDKSDQDKPMISAEKYMSQYEII